MEKRARLTARGEWRCETVHRMGRRCSGWDYSGRCIYEITLELANRVTRALGRLEVRVAGAGRGDWVDVDALRGVGGLVPESVEARVARTPLGEAILAHFLRMGDFTPEIRPLFCEVMPDHLHLIVEVTRRMARPLGNAIGGFKTGCEKIHRAQGGAGRLFKAGYVDCILFHQGQLGNWFHYLHDNPRRLAVKLLFPGLFRQVRALAVDLWVDGGARLAAAAQDGDARLAAAAQDGGARLAAAARDGCARLAAAARNGGGGPLGSAPRAPARGWFAALGNAFLLRRPLVQVQVSRRDFAYRRVPKPGGGVKIARDGRGEPLVAVETPEYARRRDAYLAAARGGAAVISPCVSDGERALARQALAAGLPLVAMQNKGFARLQKPAGRYFDACASGRLLLLAPAAWPFVPGEKPMTRLDATAMNRLCQLIAGPGAARIDYHGMAPVDIDRLAFAAARVVVV